MKILFEDNDPGNMQKDPKNYKWGIFYFSPHDPRIIVPKRNPWMGWTLNFAHPGAYFLLIGIFVFGFLMMNFFN